MRVTSIIVFVLSIVAIVLYWSPVPLVMGDIILGGYPWVAPDEAKPAMFALGTVFTIVFLALSAFSIYISRKLEELGEEEYSLEEGGYYSAEIESEGYETKKYVEEREEAEEYEEW